MKILKNEETGLLALATDDDKLVTEYIYDRLIGPNQFGLYKAYKGKPKSLDEEVGFIDSTGKEVVPVNWFYAGYDDETEYDENGYCYVLESNDNHGRGSYFYNALYDTKGNAVFKDPDIFVHPTAFGNYVLDKICIEHAQPTVCIVQNGSVVGSNIEHMSKMETKYGLFVSKTGKLVDPIYTDIGYFNKYGYALVSDKHYCGVIDENGDEVLSCKYRQIIGLPPTKEELRADDFDDYEEYLKNCDPFNGFFFAQSFNGAWGVGSFKSDVIKFKYCAFGDITNGEYLSVCDRRTRKWGIIDTNCRSIVPCMYRTDYEALENLQVYALLAKIDSKPTFDTKSLRKFA